METLKDHFRKWKFGEMQITETDYTYEKKERQIGNKDFFLK